MNNRMHFFWIGLGAILVTWIVADMVIACAHSAGVMIPIAFAATCCIIGACIRYWVAVVVLVLAISVFFLDNLTTATKVQSKVVQVTTQDSLAVALGDLQSHLDQNCARAIWQIDSVLPSSALTLSQSDQFGLGIIIRAHLNNKQFFKRLDDSLNQVPLPVSASAPAPVSDLSPGTDTNLTSCVNQPEDSSFDLTLAEWSTRTIIIPKGHDAVVCITPDERATWKKIEGLDDEERVVRFPPEIFKGREACTLHVEWRLFPRT